MASSIEGVVNLGRRVENEERIRSAFGHCTYYYGSTAFSHHISFQANIGLGQNVVGDVFVGVVDISTQR